MTRTAQLGRCLQEAEPVRTPAIHDSLYAKGRERVGGAPPARTVKTTAGAVEKGVTSDTKSKTECDESCTGTGAAAACGRHLARLNGELQWRRQLVSSSSRSWPR